MPRTASGVSRPRPEEGGRCLCPANQRRHTGWYPTPVSNLSPWRRRLRTDQVHCAGGRGFDACAHRQHARHHRPHRQLQAGASTPQLTASATTSPATLSRAMARKVLGSLKSRYAMPSDAQCRPECRLGCQEDRCRQAAKRLKVGVDIQLRTRSRRSSPGRKWRPLLLTAIFTGFGRATTRAAMVRRGPKTGELQSAARRPLQRDRQAKVEGR
jgi:hypothetical protein